MAAYSAIDDPSAFFQTALYTGTGSSQSITNDGNSDMQPDWVWIKGRSIASHNVVFDSSRGVNKRLITNLTIAEDTGDGYGVVSSFNTDGFTVNPQTNLTNVGGNGYTYVAWQWKANGGTTVSNSNGSITSTVQANTTAGFSIVSYTGTDVAGATVGHGLSQAPELWIIKRRDTADWWAVGRDTAPTQYLALNTTAAAITHTTVWNDTAPTASVFSLGTADAVNHTEAYIAYCFAEVQGFSRFGKYKGNGGYNGIFCYCGFKPAMVIIKNTDQTEPWLMYDHKRPGYNETNLKLGPGHSTTENTVTGAGDSAYNEIDIYSNGFKMTSNNGSTNADDKNFMFAAWAANPLVTSGGVPSVGF